MQATVISVKVKPNARVSILERTESGAWVAQLKSPPVDGKANQELLALVAAHFGCRKSAVSLRSGASLVPSSFESKAQFRSSKMWPNPSIERTCQGPLRAPCPAAHVKR